MDRAERQAEIEFLSGEMTKTQIALCADYRGLTVAKITALRKELRQNKAIGRVVKNTLARKSAEKVLKDADASELQKFLTVFDGPSFLVFSKEDPVAPAKVMAKFAKDNEVFKIKGGWLEGKYVDPKGVDVLSKMPGREETLSKLLALLNTPAIQLLRLMKEPGASLARVLNAHRQKLEESGAGK